MDNLLNMGREREEGREKREEEEGESRLEDKQRNR